MRNNFQNEHQCIAFADDVTILAKSKKELKAITRRISKEAKRNNEDHITVQIEEDQICNYERVYEFTYIGMKVSEDGHEEQEIETRITKGNRKFGVLRSRKTNERIYRTTGRKSWRRVAEMANKKL